VTYSSWPVIELRFRVTWNETRRRLKLRVPTGLCPASLLCEVPGGAIVRPGDGEEHVHGRWLAIEGTPAAASRKSRARGTVPAGDGPLALGIASSGQHGLDVKDGELRLSVLRSSAYCHERGFNLGTRTRGPCPLSWKYADIGVHEFRLLVTAGVPASVKGMMPGLADHLAAPPAVYAHLPFDASLVPSAETLISLKPSNVRLLACKRSWDGEALVIRIQEAVGKRAKAELKIARPQKDAVQDRGHVPEVHVPLSFTPFEIKTVRVERDGSWREAALIEETPV